MPKEPSKAKAKVIELKKPIRTVSEYFRNHPQKSDLYRVIIKQAIFSALDSYTFQKNKDAFEKLERITSLIKKMPIGEDREIMLQIIQMIQNPKLLGHLRHLKKQPEGNIAGDIVFALNYRIGGENLPWEVQKEKIQKWAKVVEWLNKHNI